MSDSEVERIMKERPPSSYGSMCSDDPEDDDKIDDGAPQPIVQVNLSTGIKLHRPDSPETTVTSITQVRGTSVYKEGVYITVQGKEQGRGEVQIEVEDDESFMAVEAPQDRDQTDVQTEPSVPEPAQSLAPTVDSTDPLSLRHIFTSMLDSLRSLNGVELLCFVRTLSSQRKGQLEFWQLEQDGMIDVLGVVDGMLERCDQGEAVHLTVRTLYDINKRDVASALENSCRAALVLFDLRASHKRRYHSLYEGTCRPGQQRYIRDVYVESLISLESLTNDCLHIHPRHLFSPREGEGRMRVIVTTGVPAIGLTVTVQMFLMDWTEERAFQDFHFVFALPGRDLHLVRNTEQTFLEFLAAFYPEARHAKFLARPNYTTLFVIDALELCKQPLDFQNNPSVTDIMTPAPADALLTSLITGDLLPHACVWITAHRSTSWKIPPSCISRLTELKGFDDSHKDEYFTKRTKDLSLGQLVLRQVKDFPDLYDACYLPLFSWIVSYVYERRLQNRAFAEQVPTLTTFYVQYVIVLTNRKIERYVGTGIEASRWKDTDVNYLMRMGQLALDMLRNRSTVFYEDSVSCLGLNVDDVTHRGGISFETTEYTNAKGRSFSFVHHSVQKFMAALYVYVKFRTTGENVLASQVSRTKTERPVGELYKLAIDRVLSLEDGNMDLFLRFLLGMVTPTVEMHLRGHLLPQYHPEPKGVEDAIKYVRKSISKTKAVRERCRNLELCLKELDECRNVR